VSPILYFAYPGELSTRTGGYGYDRRVTASLGDLGWDVRLVALGDGFPEPSEEQLQAAEALLAEIPDGSLVMIDGLAFGVMDAWAKDNRDRLKVIALVHHPLALETGVLPQQAEILRTRETEALSHTRGVVVTSPATADELVAHYGLSRPAIAVAIPGCDRVEPARGNGDTPLILSIGSLTQRKGHDVLIAALAQLQDLAWTCRIVGSKALDPATAAALEAQVYTLGLTERIQLVGQIEDVSAEFSRADVFALASRYEGYGMVFAEALAHGLPVVACRAGAVPDVVPEAAGLLVPPDDADLFARALRRLLEDRDTRRTMAQAAAEAGARLPSWADTAGILSRFLETAR
jgi:glycosyltransferase involved in cell wall biosynthesis